VIGTVTPVLTQLETVTSVLKTELILQPVYVLKVLLNKIMMLIVLNVVTNVKYVKITVQIV